MFAFIIELRLYVTVVPVERLENLNVNRLQSMLLRYEGPVPPAGLRTPTTKKDCVERLVAAGYAVEKERPVMAGRCRSKPVS
jgi:hypothetical protein